MLVIRVATFLVFCIGSGQSAQFLLTVPRKPHFDTQFTATVSAHAVYKKEYISLEYRGIIDSSRIINSTVLSFEYDGVKSWTVVFPWAQMEKRKESGVILVMNTIYKEDRKTLYFSRSTGYIFIQTDKPLYTPRQKVKFRVIAVDEYQRLAKYPLKVDIKNEKLIVMDRMRYTAEEAFKAQEFELPKETPPGNWTISASFEGINNLQRSTEIVTFEVKEYVLPRFSADLKISRDVITKSTNWISLTVTAKYVYGEKTMGSVEIQLGIWDAKEGLELMPTKHVGNLTNGKFVKDIRISEMISREQIVRENKRLYINVNVTEEGTGENDTIVDTSTFIAHPYYDITHTSAKKHFKPGFPYTLHTQVRARTGRPASWLKVWTEAAFEDAKGKRIGDKGGYYNLDQDGKTMEDYNIPSEATKLVFKTIVMDFKAGTNNDDKFEVPMLKSPNKQYLHVALVKPIKKYVDGLIKLRYTPPLPFMGSGAPVERISVLVLARGQTVMSKSVVRNTDGRSTMAIPRKLYTEISPHMRIVASFYHTGNKGSEFVVDSLWVKTDEVCLEELSLHRPGGIFASPLPKKPKDKYGLKIKGGPSMHVGMVAVDKAVFLLNNAHTLTRTSMFSQLDSHDQGQGSGDGVNIEEVLANSGLLHLFIDSDEVAVLAASTGHLLKPQNTNFHVRGHGLSSQGRESYLFNIIPDTRSGGKKAIDHGKPPQTPRNYFPESWLFKEVVLPKSGTKNLNLILPDSITTWHFMAVGLSSTRGVCVSHSLEQRVQKLFFVDVRVPYKVTRLEEVKIRIAIYNYHTEPIEIKAVVTGSEGLCFSANRYRGTQRNNTNFEMKIGARRTKSRVVKVIPLSNGDQTIKVDVYNINERDIVEREIYIVAEGLRLKKSLTFVLDPEANHAKYNKPNRKREILLADTSTFKNTIDLKMKTQKTKIDLAMPIEIIRGTEHCKISAFGDLMGDIIDHAVIKSKSLVDSPVQNAEEVLGDLGPTVHALLYANQSGLMDEALSKRAKRFVKLGVARLLKYRKRQAYSLTPSSKEGTWLTAAVLKTLCRASSLAFIDKEMLIDHGFYWLWDQFNEKNETLTERDWRLAKDSFEYQVMLSADVFIAIMECGRNEEEDHLDLMYNMAFYLEDNVESVKEPLVLAKVAYALMLYDSELEATVYAVDKLLSMSKKSPEGQVYWSSEEVTNEDRKVPFWYRKGMKASSIEATAYALLVLLKHPKTDVDPIADWLVSQRNHHGSFISALDSMAAIQALSLYSLVKSGLKVDLFCNVTSDTAKEYSHAFQFTEKNAIRPESLNNVPVGHTLEVLTKGQGLGQMQVNVEYNIPIDPNEKCPFNVTIEVKSTEVNFYYDMIDDPLCTSCSWGCQLKVDNSSLVNATDIGNDTAANTTDSMNTTTTTNSTESTPEIKRVGVPQLKPRNRNLDARMSRIKSRTRSQRYKVRGRRLKSQSRKPRSVRRLSSASRKSICLRVCLLHVEIGLAGPTRIEVDMLTGYQPVTSDIERLKNQENVLDAWYVFEQDTLVVDFKQVSDEEQTCIAFRAVDQEEVGRPTPATVIVREIGNPAPSCALEYRSPSSLESLQVYCADFSHLNRGECRCYSGLCGSCGPMTKSDIIGLRQTMDLVCRSDVGYQVQVTKVEDKDQWVEIDAKVLSVNRTGSHLLNSEDTIKMMTPSSCHCPTFFGSGKDVLYMLSSNVEKMVDRFGNNVHHYLLDEMSTFLRVADPPIGNQTEPPSKMPKSGRVQYAVPYVFMEKAFENKCKP